ncbi:MAG: hypothetical protein ACR2RE_02285 [Geminicoccaceae bacterium]
MDLAFTIIASGAAIWAIVALLKILMPALISSSVCVGCGMSAWELSSMPADNVLGFMIAANMLVFAIMMFKSYGHWKQAAKTLRMI